MPGAPLVWTPACTKAFQALKDLFISEPVLDHPDESKAFVVQVDASDAAMGAILLQANAQGKLQLCAYLSKKFTDAECNWLVWEKEAAAAFSAWRHLLEGARVPFEVWTDHKNLEALKNPRKLGAKQLRWAEFFFSF